MTEMVNIKIEIWCTFIHINFWFTSIQKNSVTLIQFQYFLCQQYFEIRLYQQFFDIFYIDLLLISTYSFSSVGMLFFISILNHFTLILIVPWYEPSIGYTLITLIYTIFLYQPSFDILWYLFINLHINNVFCIFHINLILISFFLMFSLVQI